MTNTTNSQPLLTSPSNSLDAINRRILHLLNDNARISITELAEQVNLSATPCARRIKQLEDSGIITGYHARTNAKALGYQLSLYVSVSMDKHTAERFAHFEQQVQGFAEVVSCSIVTGRTEDYLLKVMVKDMAHYEEFLLHRLNRIEGVSQVHTSFELREVFSRSLL